MANFDFQQTAQDLQDFVSRTPAEIAELRALYEALTQTGVTPVAADDWPVSDPQQNVIYRVAGTSSYTDYMWNGTDFIPMATYDNVPTDIPAVGSTDVITAGGVANHGSAFDISEYNKNGETLATYANLAAALSETNVPESVRKGGMSVKFVQSSDNKYVQYRLMTASFSTTVSDWQSVDDIVDFLCNSTEKNYVAGYYFNYNGSTVVDSDWNYTKDYIPVEPGNTILWNYGLKNNQAYLIYYNSNKEYIDYFSASDNSGKRTLTASADCHYVRASFYKTVIDVISVNGTLVFHKTDTFSGLDTRLSVMPQALTDSQKSQALTNLGLGSSIDEEPTANSNNLVRSGGVDSWGKENYGAYAKNPDWIRVITDSNKRILAGIKEDGSVEWFVGVPTPVKEYVDGKSIDYIMEEKSDVWIFVVTDSDDKILCGIKEDGSVYTSGSQANNELLNYYGVPSADITTYWNSQRNKDIRSQMLKSSNFNALFFSDIHGSDERFKRIIALGNDWNSLLNCIIDGGDDSKYNQDTTPLDWFNASAQTSNLPIMRAVGNHDAWKGGDWVWATAQEIYEYFTSPAVTLMQSKGITVVQPSDASTAYRNYYYVDYGNVRVICLLSLTYRGTNRYYDSEQDAWFKSVLADAITNSKAVICVNHGPLNPSNSDAIVSNWYSWLKWDMVADNQHVDDAAVSAVDDFIDDGGTFICWLSGHTHIDYVMTSKNTVHKQFCFTTSTAKGSTTDGSQPQTVDSEGYDLLNMISVDLTNHLVKIWRIGFNDNAATGKHNTFCWDYLNEVKVCES